MKKMIDLFAGCGGLSLGMENAGFEVEFANEINSSFFNTYLNNRKLTKDDYFVGDICELNKKIDYYSNKFKDLDLVCGGPPCQGFSMANRQRVIDDPRNILYRSFLQFLNFAKPKFFVMENVKGMSKKIDEILLDFERYLGTEYNLDHALINAKNYGIPQNRERFFLIGNKLNINTKDVFKALKKNYFKINNFVLKDAIKDLPKLQPNRIKNKTKFESSEIGYYRVNYKYKKTAYYYYINGNRTIKNLYNHRNRYNNDRDIEIFSILPQGENSLHSSIKHIMPYKSRNHIFKDKYFKLDENFVSKTITSHMKYDCNMYIHPTQARGISPREAARVQTFPDDYVFSGAPNNWYAQIGNAVPVKLAEYLGNEIIKYL